MVTFWTYAGESGTTLPKVAHIKFPSIYENIDFSESTMPIELEFHMETAYDRLAKIYTNCFGHMTKMATTPIYG